MLHAYRLIHHGEAKSTKLNKVLTPTTELRLELKLDTKISKLGNNGLYLADIMKLSDTVFAFDTRLKVGDICKCLMVIHDEHKNEDTEEIMVAFKFWDDVDGIPVVEIYEDTGLHDGIGFAKIHTSGHMEQVFVDPKKTLHGYYELINCSTIDIIKLEGNLDIILDDNGKLTGKEPIKYFQPFLPVDFLAGDILVGNINEKTGDFETLDNNDYFKIINFMRYMRDYNQEEIAEDLEKAKNNQGIRVTPWNF